MTQAILDTLPYKNGPWLRSSLLNSNHFIWLTAIVLSLLTHGILFFQRNSQHNAVPAMVIQETITHVRFASISPPPITVIEPEIIIPEPEPVVIPPKVPEKTVVIQKPDPVVKPVVVEKKSKPKAKKKKKPTPKPIKQVQKKKTVQKPPVKVEKTLVKPQATAFNTRPQINKDVKTSPIVSKADQRLIEQTRKSYYALLMRHIEVHKHYPRVARKRKIEGKILVTFTLLANGNIKNLQINGKRSILEKATKDAINAALPMPPPPRELSLPQEITFTMNYFLK